MSRALQLSGYVVSEQDYKILQRAKQAIDAGYVDNIYDSHDLILWLTGERGD